MVYFKYFLRSSNSSSSPFNFSKFHKAPFPLEKIPLGSAKNGWQVREGDEEGGYQFIFQTPYSEGLNYLEAESKTEKAKWMEVLGQGIKKVILPAIFSSKKEKKEQRNLL